ncbi:TIGR04222 domain-containing membrane protein [Micromonospora sp. DT233]|uniref:TIGR04222 domain-containing membrane protein n=1 Tax=Micromonospora sp. DT233 TaxID=3393432 RepID=UPI003CF7B341
MIVLAAPGDTWGVPSRTFLALYLAAALVIVVGALVHRRRLFSGPPVADVGQLGPQQVAFLNGGEQLAIWTALGGLRGTGVVGVRSDRRLATGGPLPSGCTPLDYAIHHAAHRNRYARELRRDEQVRRAVEQLREGLERQGLVVGAKGRSAARRASIVLALLAVLGVFRTTAGLSNDRPVAYLILLLFPVVLAAVLLRRVPRRTRAADAALRDLRRRNAHLAPTSAPAFATYGAAGAAMGVALFGTASLWAMDPGFAEQAEIQRQALTGSGYASGGGSGCGGASSCSGGSSSCSGGSSCGGGGGCGG